CKGRAVTQLHNNIHYLKNFTIHKSHAPELHNAEVAKFSSEIKRQAQETRDKPSKIIQENIINIPEAIRPYLPSTNACHRKIQHVRHTGLPPQPQNIAKFDVPNNLQNTLNDKLFLVNDQLVGQS
ncbi:1375_t:CDS:1, partial [Dentiscutata erythropus]